MNQRHASAITGLILLCGCASTPQLPPIRAGSAVAIEVAAAPDAQGGSPIENTALGRDTATGAKTGTWLGGLWGIACGPFAFFCIPVGAGIGALTGSVAGAGIGLTGALSEEDATKLRERLQRVLQANPPADQLRRDVADRARVHWRVATAEASVSVNIELRELVLTSTRDKQISFIARVLVSTRPSAADAPVKRKLYEHVSPPTNLVVWLDQRSDFVDTSLRLAMQQLAAQIVSELARS